MTWTAPSKGGYSAKHGRKQGEPFPKTPEAFTAPVSDTRREDVVREIERAIRQSFESDDHAHTYRRAALAVLAVLPAPPVVDEAEIADAILARYSSFDPLTAQGIAAVVAARLRGATRG